MSDIVVYQQEIDDGLEDFVRNNKIVLSSEIQICDKFDVEESQLPEEYMKIVDSVGDPDLLYYKSVLTSTGLNKNHHYFLPEALWLNKDTAVYKRTNLEHEEPFIIGSDIRSYAVDFEGKLIPDDTPLHKIPDEFDIVTDGVIYRAWTDKKQQKEIDEVIKGMYAGKYSVSAETAYKSFDYVLVAEDGTKEFIKRTKQTSHLTKYYQSRQSYNGKKVGIVLNDFVFAGKGIVKNPANPRSKITEIEKKSEKIVLTDKIKDYEVYNTIGENMDYQKMFEEAQKELTVTKDKVTELNKQVGELATVNTKLNEEVKVAKDSLDALVKSNEAAIAEKVKEVTVALASIEELNKAVKEYKDKETYTLRVDSVQTKLEMTKEEATAFVEKFKKFDDEAFTLVVDNTVIKKPELQSGKPHQDLESKLVKTVDLVKATDSLETAKVEENVNPSAKAETKVQANKAEEQIHKLFKKTK